jgi:transcriptional regulator with XRE-family HTH domain
MTHSFHIGSVTSTRPNWKTFRFGQALVGAGVYGIAMTERIGPLKPFRHYIREWMEKREINQERMAGRLEIESGTVSKLLSGRMRLSDKWLSAFAAALDVEVADLFVDPNRPTQADLLAGLSDDQRATVISLIEMLKRTG